MPRKRTRAATPLGDPIQADVRLRRYHARYGPNPRCILCPESRPEALLRVTRKFIEMHHLVCYANDADLVVPLCLNCHRSLTEAYRTAGVSTDEPETLLHQLLAALLSFSVFFPLVGASCGTWAAELRGLIDWFDTYLPEWKKCVGRQHK